MFARCLLDRVNGALSDVKRDQTRRVEVEAKAITMRSKSRCETKRTRPRLNLRPTVQGRDEDQEER